MSRRAEREERTGAAAPLCAAVFAALMASGCATDYKAIRAERTAKVEPAAAELVGKTERQLVAQMGVPKNSYEFAKGGRILHFVRTEFWSKRLWRCEVQVTLDQNGYATESKIVEWDRSIYGSNLCLELLGKRPKS